MNRRDVIKQGGLAALALAIPRSLTALIKYNPMIDSKKFDVIIIGGSYSGLSAAMALGRSLRNVLIIDSGLPCNRQTPHSHNFITHDGEKPSIIAEKAKSQVLNYSTVKFLNDVAVSGKKIENGFVITTQKGEEIEAKKLVFATGIKDTMPDIKGLAECWGISVVHCPYCHGYELRNKNTGIIADGVKGFHLASMVNNLTNKLTLLTNSKADFTEEQRVKLNKHDIAIIETTIKEIEHKNGIMNNVIFSDGSKKAFDGLYAALPFTQHSDIPTSLGCELTELGYLKVSPFQETNITGVFACGDNSSMMRSVANAVYTGNLTGAVVNGKLVEEKF
ncbi:pyridine nucleotide-disulfide oxidoreductase [Sphingobacteriaceae bacterium]|nr:pyridine nucleotide-disulfide oxidoreductase [Sphingobacteriaceae bacterium]